MIGFPASRYRPTRVSDGAGGYAETLGSATTVYGLVVLHENRTALVCDADEDVDVGDLVDVDAGGGSGRYRVTAISRQPGATGRRKSCALERLARPVEP